MAGEAFQARLTRRPLRRPRSTAVAVLAMKPTNASADSSAPQRLSSNGPADRVSVAPYAF